VPLHRSRRQRFDEFVVASADRLSRRWEHELEDVDFAVEDVPPVDPPVVPARGDAEPALPRPVLARAFPRTGRHKARIVVYRRPIESRTRDEQERESLVHEVVVEQVADLLGLEPETVDPGYEGRA
jgi:predicted Zn-dependent protease with MMP-like domain